MWVPNYQITNYHMMLFKSTNYVIGVDEVGRGPLAGPVVVAAILVDASILEMPVKDSKLLPAKRREELARELIAKYRYSIAIVEPSVIDKINILNAVKKAMTLAITELKHLGDYPVYVDGNQKPFEDENMHAIVKGDLLLKPISAASIIAKVERDKIMSRLALDHPNYSWDSNAGYGTKAHIEAIKQFGVTKEHRMSFLGKIEGIISDGISPKKYYDIVPTD